MAHIRSIAALASVVAATAVTAVQPEAAHADDPLPPQACATAAGAPQAAVTVDAQAGALGAVTVGAQAAVGQVAPLSYTIDWGDTVVDSGHSGVMNHIYPTLGNWPVRVTVTDAHGVSATSVVCTVQSTQPANSEHRLGGATRYETGAAVSQSMWASISTDGYVPDPARRQAHAVVLASGANFPDALAGVPLAEYKQGPLLLTDPSTLTPVTEAEILRVLPRGETVYILGGTSAVSQAVQDQVVHMGYTVVRYGGSDRYGTAMQIATKGLDSPASVFVVTGTDFADALAAGPQTVSDTWSVDGKPAAIVLTNGATFSDSATAAFVKARLGFDGYEGGHPWHVFGAGGAAARALFQLDTGHVMNIPLMLGCADSFEDYEYVAGADRYATAACLTGGGHDEPGAGFDVRTVGLASGTSFADALTGAAAIAERGETIQLTQQDYLPPATVGALQSAFGGTQGTVTLDIFGGESAVSAGVEAQAKSYMP